MITQAAAEEMLEALRIIIANARIQPDVEMGGLTDIYAVPIDDIERAMIAANKAGANHV